MTIRSLCFVGVLVLSVISSSTGPPSGKTQQNPQLAYYEWKESGWTNNILVQQIGKPEQGEYAVAFNIGLKPGDGGGFGKATDASRFHKFRFRQGYEKPFVEVSPRISIEFLKKYPSLMSNPPLEEIVNERIGFDPHPWESALAVIDHRKKLEEVQAMWVAGSDREKEAAEVLKRLLDFEWEEKSFYVQFTYWGPRTLVSRKD